jgi:hypothetical protein
MEEKILQLLEQLKGDGKALQEIYWYIEGLITGRWET